MSETFERISNLHWQTTGIIDADPDVIGSLLGSLREKYPDYNFNVTGIRSYGMYGIENICEIDIIFNNQEDESLFVLSFDNDWWYSLG